MPEVKVRRQGITAEQAGTAIRGSLGESVEITQDGDRQLSVSKGLFARAKVEMAEEPGGTVFAVRGAGVPFPLVYIVTRIVNEKGLAAQVARAIGADEGFRDNG